MRASLPPDHPDLASAEMNLASALRELDRCAEAVPHSQRALAILDHLHKTGPDLAQAELTFGMCQSDLHHDREATELLRNVLAEYERAGLHGDDLAEPLAGLAELAYRGGHHAEGIEFINRSLAVIGTPRPETQQLHDYLTAELATWRKAR
jgi:tetratricopeptide (TPR) repeat protein